MCELVICALFRVGNKSANPCNRQNMVFTAMVFGQGVTDNDKLIRENMNMDNRRYQW